MASSDSPVRIVDSADVAGDGRMVHVESAEKASFFSFLTGARKEETEDVKTEESKSKSNTEKKETESAPNKEEVHVHDGEGIKTTYDVEEDFPPSLLEQLKRKVHWNGR